MIGEGLDIAVAVGTWAVIAAARYAWRAWRRPRYHRHVGVGDAWPVNKDWMRNHSVRKVK